MLPENLLKVFSWICVEHPSHKAGRTPILMVEYIQVNYVKNKVQLAVEDNPMEIAELFMKASHKILSNLMKKLMCEKYKVIANQIYIDIEIMKDLKNFLILIYDFDN